jgi:4-diphosphocytidyl-2C-methyl-D-erythritol kinase
MLFLRNSVVVAVGSTVASMIIGCLGAYAIARLNFPGRALLARGLVVTYLVPASLLFIPLFAMMSALRLTDSLFGLSLTYLGSDVPFFLSPESFAVGRGRGERCEGVAGSVRLAHVLVVPPERLSTKEMYAGAHFDLTARKPSISIVGHALRNGSLGELADGLWNDLEPEAIRRCPVIATIQAHLREHGCLGVLVSGSGSSIFGLCADGTQAYEVAARLPAYQGQAQAGIRGLASGEWRVEIVHTEHPSRIVTPALP